MTRAKSVSLRDQPTGWTTELQLPAGTVMGFYLFATSSRPFWGPPSLLSKGTGDKATGA